MNNWQGYDKLTSAIKRLIGADNPEALRILWEARYQVASEICPALNWSKDVPVS